MKLSHQIFTKQIQQRLKFHTELIVLCEKSKKLVIAGTFAENTEFIKTANAILAKRP